MKHDKCNCYECPLLERSFVPTKKGNSPKIAIIGDYPTRDDAMYKIPFSDQMGEFILEQLSINQIASDSVLYTNVIACTLDKKLQFIMSDVKKKNKKTLSINKERRKQGFSDIPLMPSPQKACRGRLLEELQDIDKFVVFGTDALEVFLGDKNINAKNLRGSPINVEFGGRIRTIFPMLHPRFLYLFPHWKSVFISDMHKMVKLFNSSTKWVEPDVIYTPTIEQVKSFLELRKQCNERYIGFDIEVDGINSTNAKIRCISLGYNKKSIVIPFVTKRGNVRYYEQITEWKIVKLLKTVFEDNSIVKIGHNVGYFDCIILYVQLGILCHPIMDTMLLHKIVSSRLPHDLGFCGSLYTDAPNWKWARQERLSYETDVELHKYCAYDTIICLEIFKFLWSKIIANGLQNLIYVDHAIQKILVKMRLRGVLVHPLRIYPPNKNINKNTSRWHNEYNSHSNKYGFVISDLFDLPKGSFIPNADSLFLEITFPNLEMFIFSVLHNLTPYIKNYGHKDYSDTDYEVFDVPKKIDKRLLRDIRLSCMYDDDFAETYKLKDQYKGITTSEMRFLIERWKKNTDIIDIQAQKISEWVNSSVVEDPILKRKFIIEGDEHESELHRFQTLGAMASIIRLLVIELENNVDIPIIHFFSTNIILECPIDIAYDKKNYIINLITNYKFALFEQSIVCKVDILSEW